MSNVVTVEAPSDAGAWACTGTQDPQDADEDPGVSRGTPRLPTELCRSRIRDPIAHGSEATRGSIPAELPTACTAMKAWSSPRVPNSWKIAARGPSASSSGRISFQDECPTACRPSDTWNVGLGELGPLAPLPPPFPWGQRAATCSSELHMRQVITCPSRPRGFRFLPCPFPEPLPTPFPLAPRYARTSSWVTTNDRRPLCPKP